MAYKYDVFLSYRHGTKVQAWVRDHFLPELAGYLEDELPSRPRIFWDRKDIGTGDLWANSLSEGLRTARCLLPIWAPSYFRSDFCLAELKAFEERERQIGIGRGGRGATGLIIPILWHANIPHEHRLREPADFSGFTWTGKSFEKSDRYLSFQEEVKRLAARVGKASGKAPAFSEGWPFPAPEVFEDLHRQGDPARPKISRPMMGAA